jgi:hypothetical protein
MPNSLHGPLGHETQLGTPIANACGGPGSYLGIRFWRVGWSAGYEVSARSALERGDARPHVAPDILPAALKSVRPDD